MPNLRGRISRLGPRVVPVSAHLHYARKWSATGCHKPPGNGRYRAVDAGGAPLQSVPAGSCEQDPAPCRTSLGDGSDRNRQGVAVHFSKFNFSPAGIRPGDTPPRQSSSSSVQRCRSHLPTPLAGRCSGPEARAGDMLWESKHSIKFCFLIYALSNICTSFRVSVIYALHPQYMHFGPM